MLVRVFLVSLTLLFSVSLACGGSSNKNSDAQKSSDAETGQVKAALPDDAPSILNGGQTGQNQATSLPACRIIPSLAKGVVSQDKFQLKPVKDGVPTNLNSYLGVWEGYFGAISDSIRFDPSAIVVRSISLTEADVSFISGGVEIKAQTQTYQVTSEGKLKGVYSPDQSVFLMLSLNTDGKLRSEINRASNPAQNSIAEMSKCDLAAVKALPEGSCRILQSLAPGALLTASTVIEPAGSNVPANLSAYLGIWEGYWDGTSPSLFIVRAITPSQATTAYVFEGRVQDSLNTHAVAGSKLQSSGRTASLSWEMTSEGLKGVLTENGRPAGTVSMSRCNPV